MNKPISHELLMHPANRARVRKIAQAIQREREGRAQQEQAEREAQALQADALNHEAERAKCAGDIIHWFNTWLWTYNPKITDPNGRYLRFRLFPKQVELLLWAQERIAHEEQGAVPKSRDVGASYLFAALALHKWLFEDGFSATFGSRVEDNVDIRGNPDTIFEKLRIMARRLPAWMMPPGFNWAKHDKYMLFENPATGATISGEGGKNMGRAGRSTFYVMDEAAHVEKAEAVEAALSGNTDVVFWVSSANGPGNLFARKSLGGLEARQVFRLHYTDDPRKTPEWVAKKRASMEPVNWASEYEIDFSASLEGVCIPGLWVASSQALRKMLRPTMGALNASAGLDVGAGGKGKSVFVSRNGPWVRVPVSRGDPDTIGTANWALALAREQGAILLNYDSPGVGNGVTSALKHIPRLPNGDQDRTLHVQPVNTGEPPTPGRQWPDKRTSKEWFGNLKAELWWLTRVHLQRAHELYLFLTGDENGVEHDLSEVLLLPSGDRESDTMAAQLSMVKAETNTAGKIVIETKKALQKRGIPSPDYADAIILSLLEKRGRYNIDALG